LGFVQWRTIMLLCAAWGAIMIVLWFALFPHIFKKVDISEEKAEISVPTSSQKALPIPLYIFGSLALIMPGIMLQGMLRDGVTNWMPSFLLETFGLNEENSIVSTVILAIFTMISYSAFAALQKRFFKNEVTCAATIFGGSAVICAALFAVNLLAPRAALVPSLVLMALTVAGMHGVNLMLISIVPRRFVVFGKVSTYSGILNASTYVGAALSTYGFAALAEIFDWNFTILTWVAMNNDESQIKVYLFTTYTHRKIVLIYRCFFIFVRQVVPIILVYNNTENIIFFFGQSLVNLCSTTN
jgi:OPA family glycerol-3-phosphate transporter-like MFS transporter